MDALMDAIRDRPKNADIIGLARAAARGQQDKPMQLLGDAMAHLHRARGDAIAVANDIAGVAAQGKAAPGAGLPASCLFDEVRATAKEIHAVAEAIEAAAAALRAQI